MSAPDVPQDAVVGGSEFAGFAAKATVMVAAARSGPMALAATAVMLGASSSDALPVVRRDERQFALCAANTTEPPARHVAMNLVCCDNDACNEADDADTDDSFRYYDEGNSVDSVDVNAFFTALGIK